MPALDHLPRVTSRSKRAWALKRRCKPFRLVHQGQEYFVDRGGWARPLDDSNAISVQVVKLLDPGKRPTR